jgi:thiol-disulfide isomerase/thioredoxin
VGSWTDHSRPAYSIPFTGGINQVTDCVSTSEDFTFNVIFSPSDTTDTSKGVAVLLKKGSTVTGTILTETGDYRYLQGEWLDGRMWLSAFDGTHLFYLDGQVNGDSISNGLFLSGKHWKENWVAVKSNIHSLRNPYSITTLRIDKNPTFSVLDGKGDSIAFDSTSWKNHVSIIQVMGSWCPNCTDESRFLKELYAEHSKEGLQIIPIAFERGDDVSAACRRVTRQFTQLLLPYPFYYGGKAGKEEAQKVLNFLEEVHSFPTTIFIDKNGNIRKVFTGFYGPGTHHEYELHTAEIKALITTLLQE